MVAERISNKHRPKVCCSLAKISMVAELDYLNTCMHDSCSLAKISMVAEQTFLKTEQAYSCSLAKISMVAERTPY